MGVVEADAVAVVVVVAGSEEKEAYNLRNYYLLKYLKIKYYWFY